MAFVKKTWKSRLVQYPNRRVLTDVSTQEQQTVTVARSEGEVTQAGDAFSAANMNDLEDRISNAFDGDYVESILYANTTTVDFQADWIQDGECYDVAMPLAYSKVVYSNIQFLSPHTIRLTFQQQPQNITVRLYRK